LDIALQNELAALLATLRSESRQQSGLEARLQPADKAEGYRVAQKVADELGWAVAGWKIAATNAEMQKALRSETPIYGRVFAPLVKPSPYRISHASLCSPIPEVEFQARLGRDLPPRDGRYTVEEVGAAVQSLHPGLELAECRFRHDKNFPPLAAILADGAGSGTLVYGPAIENWRDIDIAGQEVRLYCNGALRRQGTAAAALEHPLVPLTWLANELSQNGIGMKSGQTISTGTMTGMVAAKPGETYRADFGPLGEVSATYE